MRVFELHPMYDACKSFYGKAKVIELDDGSFLLQSYDTTVSRCVGGIVTHLGKWSATTSRHQKEFERQYGEVAQ